MVTLIYLYHTDNTETFELVAFEDESFIFDVIIGVIYLKKINN